MAGELAHFYDRVPKGAEPAEQTEEPYKPGWFKRRLIDLKIWSMPTTQTKPPGYINWTLMSVIVGMLASVVVIVTAIAGLWYFTAQTYFQSGYDKGKLDTEKLQLQKEVDTQASDINTLKRVAGLLPPTPKPTPERK